VAALVEIEPKQGIVRSSGAIAVEVIVVHRMTRTTWLKVVGLEVARNNW
jgi:hypothetical protein